MTVSYIKRGNLDTNMNTGSTAYMNVETGVMLLEAKECQRLFANHQRFREP